jgi:hypothetical protein
MRLDPTLPRPVRSLVISTSIVPPTPFRSFL